MIYEHVVDSETHTEITRENIRVQSSLLKTCSLMRQEATPIYYKQTRFLITLDPDMKLEVDEWLHVIGPSNAALISNLVVKLCIGSGFISLVLNYHSMTTSRRLPIPPHILQEERSRWLRFATEEIRKHFDGPQQCADILRQRGIRMEMITTESQQHSTDHLNPVGSAQLQCEMRAAFVDNRLCTCGYCGSA